MKPAIMPNGQVIEITTRPANEPSPLEVALARVAELEAGIKKIIADNHEGIDKRIIDDRRGYNAEYERLRKEVHDLKSEWHGEQILRELAEKELEKTKQALAEMQALFEATRTPAQQKRLAPKHIIPVGVAAGLRGLSDEEKGARVRELATKKTARRAAR